MYSLSTTLAVRGHHVKVVVPTDGWLPMICDSAGIPTHATWMKGTGWFKTMGYLMREVRRSKIDVVHTHLTRAAYIGHYLGLFTGVPIVTSVHIANNDQIYRRLARRRNRLVAVSNFVRGMLHGRGVPERYIDTIYNGTDFVDIEPHSPDGVKDEFGIPRDRQLVGLVARVCRDKGQLEMVSAIKQVREEHPLAHLLCVGRIEEGFESEMNHMIEKLGMRDHVTFTGVRHDIPRMLDSFVMSSLPSRMETFGVAAIEAMARGKAVVATRVGALPEVVRHQQTGLLVELSPDEIAGAVSYLLTNEDEREEMGRRGRSLVEQKFTLGEMGRRFESVYQRAAGR